MADFETFGFGKMDQPQVHPLCILKTVSEHQVGSTCFAVFDVIVLFPVHVFVHGPKIPHIPNPSGHMIYRNFE